MSDDPDQIEDIALDTVMAAPFDGEYPIVVENLTNRFGDHVIHEGLSLKVRRGAGKWILREWLAREFPAARPHARKQGFTVPVGAWIAARADRLAPLIGQHHHTPQAAHAR